MFSHDFRTPLSIIMSSTGLLRNYAHALTEERREKHFDRVEASVGLLIQMLDDMLLYAQMGSGKFNYEPQSIAVGDFLQKIVDEFLIIHDDLYEIVYDNALMQDYLVDPRLLRQVATNLISNAIKYSPQHSRIDVIAREEDNNLVLVVEDEGIGIPQDEQHKLFNIFQRASNVGDTKGTGLGLAIVKQALDLQGGSVVLQSQLDEGSRFIVTIPARSLQKAVSA
jgi:signal transduction histidine kinase